MAEQMFVWQKYNAVVINKTVDCSGCGGFSKKITYTSNPGTYIPTEDKSPPPRGYKTALSPHASGAMKIINTSGYDETYNQSQFHTPVLNAVQVPTVGIVQVPDGYCASYKETTYFSQSLSWSTHTRYAMTSICTKCNGTGKEQAFSHYIQGAYLSTVTAIVNTYPQNGRHTDGFWYVYQGLANKSPTISGSNANLGTVTAVNHAYSINDEDTSDALTCVEKLDGVTLRTFTPVRNTNYVVALPQWIEIRNGTHTITILVTDQVGATATRTVTFSKAEHELEFMLAEPLCADALITKTIMSITRVIPSGAEITVEICNNGFDEVPTWENITAKVVAEKKFYFTNTVKTAENWGYNLRIKLNRNNADGACYINSVGGCFE